MSKDILREREREGERDAPRSSIRTEREVRTMATYIK